MLKLEDYPPEIAAILAEQKTLRKTFYYLLHTNPDALDSFKDSHKSKFHQMLDAYHGLQSDDSISLSEGGYSHRMITCDSSLNNSHSIHSMRMVMDDKSLERNNFTNNTKNKEMAKKQDAPDVLALKMEQWMPGWLKKQEKKAKDSEGDLQAAFPPEIKELLKFKTAVDVYDTLSKTNPGVLIKFQKENPKAFNIFIKPYIDSASGRVDKRTNTFTQLAQLYAFYQDTAPGELMYLQMNEPVMFQQMKAEYEEYMNGQGW